MKTILCYGDAMTWGQIPGTWDDRINMACRYPKNKRWPGVMADALGSGYDVIEEGLSGRTTVYDDPFRNDRNGKTFLPVCLESHAPVDLVIMMLGLNDLKHRYGLSAFDVAHSVAILIKLIKQSHCGPEGGAPEVLLLAPHQLGALNPLFAEVYANKLSDIKKLALYYQRVSEEYDCFYYDTNTCASASDVDGVHLDDKAHKRLGKALSDYVIALFEHQQQPPKRRPQSHAY